MSDTPYEGLTPERMLDAVDSIGHQTDGSLTALNSYENRVYQVGVEDGPPIIVKFYRPERWTDAMIFEEHRFIFELVEHELPCVAPFRHNGQTLFEYDGFRFSAFPREAGRPPNVEDYDVLAILGHTLGRMHAIGATKPFESRQHLTVDRLGVESREFLLANDFVPPDMRAAYESVTKTLVDRIREQFDTFTAIRIHGDCHMGNVLWRYDAPNFVDFDDTVMGPAIQDLWMLLSGDRAERSMQLSEIATAYDEFFELSIREVPLIEPLRTLRIMHHAAWIARRWNDPAFPLAFPTFNDLRYWGEHVLSLKEQLAMLDEPPLSI